MPQHKRIDIDLQFDVKIKGNVNDPPIKDKDYVETIIDELGIPIKYVFKNRNNLYVNPDELTVTVKGAR